MQNIDYKEFITVLNGQVAQRRILFRRLQEEKQNVARLNDAVKALGEELNGNIQTRNKALELCYRLGSGLSLTPDEHESDAAQSPAVLVVRDLLGSYRETRAALEAAATEIAALKLAAKERKRKAK